MKSFTKYEVELQTIESMFAAAGFRRVQEIRPLTAGEFNSAYRVSADGGLYVLKISPQIGSSHLLTYEKELMQEEVRYYRLIAEQTQVKTPKIYYSDFSRTLLPADFFIMEYLGGKPLNTVKLSPVEKKEVHMQIGAMFAQLHQIKGIQFGYEQNGLHGNWFLAIRAMTRNLIEDCRRYGKPCKYGEKLLAYIDRFQSLLASVSSTYTHFDIWEGNLFYEKKDGRTVLTLIDTERSFWGDPIGEFLSIGLLKPLEQKTDLLSGYNHSAEKPITFTKEEQIRYQILSAYLGVLIYTEKFARYRETQSKYWFNVAGATLLCGAAFHKLEQLSAPGT